MSSNRSRMFALPLIGVLLLGAGQLNVRSAAAQSAAAANDASVTTCSTDMLKGRYVLSGGGTIAGDEADVIGNWVFDGSGALTEGSATVALQRVAVPAEHVTLKDGTYSVGKNCAGKLKFFVVHDNKMLTANDHGHLTEILVFDGGRQFALITMSTELPGATNNMSEGVRLMGHRV